MTETHDNPDPAARREALAKRLAMPGAGVHLAGICGVGMAGLAALLKARGLTVSGCDLMVNRLAGWLRERGIPVAERHAPEHLTAGVSWVIRSAAVPDTEPEIAEALDRGLPVFRRGEVLAALAGGAGGIAVGGTHGKTTTTAFVAQLLTAAGRDPTFCIGGEVVPLGGVARAGAGPETVVEADESDGTLALYQPGLAVVTNIEFDHMEHFAGVEEFEDCFRTFIRAASRRVIYCADDPRAARLCAPHPLALAYGLGASAALRATDLKESAGATTFTVHLQGQALGAFTVPAPGRHNVLNALAALAACLEVGTPPDVLREGLARVALPRRRFERFIDRDDVIIISDYAHHPGEIAALVRAAQRLHRPRLIAVFQPHRYTRTLALGRDFPASFNGLSEVVLCPVYAASEVPLEGGTTWDLYAHCRALATPRVTVASSLTHAWDYLRNQLRLGDVLLVIGAGDVDRIAVWARDELRDTRIEELESLMGRIIRQVDLTSTVVKGQEPLGPKTTLGVGGKADVWMEIGCEADLVKVLRWTRLHAIPFRVLGGGSNVVISDLGVRGVVARLGGAAFRTLAIRDDLVVAGAGVPLAQLLGWLAERTRAGLEFLEGIPGTVGGALHGNAGAWGRALGDHVEWVRAMDEEGKLLTLDKTALRFGYRSAPLLRGLVLLEAGLRTAAGTADEIRTRREAHASRRAWMRGLRSAGSLFKNPAGDFAGRLLEASGLKGRGIGGATISREHANVIVTTPEATASDVLALVDLMRATVRREHGVILEPEVQIWD
jgi:UDP-N-acetylmuramate--L-alanine ligase/UDP-N-acetylenolpyruvoylglucosamine reductase